MNKVTFLLTAMLVLVGCSKNSEIVDQLWNEAENLRQQENLGAAISKLVDIKTNFPDDPKAAEAQFMVGEIYLNDVKNYPIALEEFKTVIHDFPKSEMAEKAFFMIGYIYTNYLQAFSDGIEYYNLFLEKYPKSELVAAVKYELESLADVEKEILELSTASKTHSEVAN
ncbi:MAG: outer membrane protein assembly factor BamD [Candidatus Marinimicrobia bacterium]|nr:outer membrane protein assembly factor BamD [Candidatus Neomarinimicrobiota bacterium]